MSEAVTLSVRKRHKWDDSVREEFITTRICSVCDLRKITDHNVWPPAMFYRDSRGERISPMPECD